MSGLLASLILLLPAVGAAASTTAPTAAPVATIETGRPPLVDPARDWPQFLATADAGTALSAYEVLSALYDSEGGMKADCATHLPEVDRAIRTVPVGIALWRGGERCARSVKDEAAASFYGEGVSRLAAYGLAKDSTGPWNPPIRVVRMDDISALVEATGFEALYSYSDRSRSPRHMVITQALWDAESKRERHLSFDFLDTLFQLKTSEKFSGYPAYRLAMRSAFEKAMEADDSDFGKDLAAADASRALTTGSAAVERLRETAAAGGLSSVRLWLGNCEHRAFDGCANGLVDALLPFAERQLAMYQIQLALAYARGIGVKKDLDAALTLVDAAEKRWGGGNATAQFAEQFMDVGGVLPGALMDRLLRAANAGSDRAGMARMRAMMVGEKTDKLGADTLAVVLPLAGKGFAEARLAAYRHYSEVGDWTNAMSWLRRDAEAGNGVGAERWATELLTGDHVPRDVEAGRALMHKAAMADSTSAMVWLGYEARRAKRWPEAEAWYASGLAYEDEAALAGLLFVYGEQREGLDKGPAAAQAVYEAMAAGDSALYRRMYADFLLHKAPKRDPEKARRLLAGDAGKGDLHSQFDLAVAMINGDFGKADVEAGMALIEKAMAADTKGEVADRMAYYLFYKQRTPAARERALEIERSLVQRKYLPAINNLSWWLCTSPDESVRAPSEGLTVAAKLGDPDSLNPGAVDTVAACHAAVGQFDRAVALETRVLERSARYPLGAEAGELEGRLQGYKQGRAYLEPADAKGD